MKIKYYLVEKIKDRFMTDAFNTNIIKQTGKNLEMLSSKVIKPIQIGIELNKNGKISCVDKKYKVKEIAQKESLKILEDMEKNYGLWRGRMSTSENYASLYLSGGGEKL